MTKNLLYSLLIFSSLNACINTNNFNRGYLEKEIQEVVEVPFEMYRGLILLEAEFNGVKGKFLFDNGASFSCLNKDYADKCRIKFKSGERIRDGNNNRTFVKESTAKDISIANIHFKNTGIYLIDTKKFFPCKEDIDGILGASVINKINWLIDFKEEKLRISSKKFDNGGTPFKIAISSNNSSFLGFMLNGFPVKAKIDFGYQGSLKLRMKEFKNKFSGYSAEQNLGITSLSISGLGKSDTTYDIYENIEMKKGEALMPYPPEINLTKNLKYTARIGLDFFRNYEVVVNSNEKEYQLKAYESALDEEDFRAHGVSIFEVEDEYRIIQIQPGIIEDKDINIMDKVESINGTAVEQFSDFCELREFLSKGREKQETLYLRLKGKEEDFALPYQKAKLLSLP